MAIDFANLGKEFGNLATAVGIGKDSLQKVQQTPSDPAVKTALDSLDAAVAQAKTLAATPIDDDAKKAERAALTVQIQADQVIAQMSEDFQERVDAQNELHVLRSQLEVLETEDAVQFGNLIYTDPSRTTLIQTMIEEAGRDIAARQDLSRVLLGVQMLLQTIGFAAALAAKIAV